ncbi:TraB/GumN family protein [Flavilitoribacter nigricans]|nr:TraB/GumN family protein [Flavilitoribacter nigricans]
MIEMIRVSLLIVGIAMFTGITDGKAALLPDTLKTNTILFRVTHPDRDQISYLFGTHHAFGESFFNELQHAGDALGSSDLLIKENLNIPGHRAEDIINLRTSTTSWKKFLNHSDLAFVSNVLAASPVDLQKMTPTELHTVLSRYYKEKVCLSKDPTDSHLTLDDYIGSLAEAHRIRMVGLETTEEQIELINRDVRGMPRKVHKKRLAAIIDRLRRKSDDNCREIEWYRKMDFDYRLTQACQNRLVLTDRNERWMAEIEPYLKTNNCFIAVGLSHLMFECGLIAQLEERGYTIVPVAVR